MLIYFFETKTSGLFYVDEDDSCFLEIYRTQKKEKVLRFTRNVTVTSDNRCEHPRTQCLVDYLSLSA